MFLTSRAMCLSRLGMNTSLKRASCKFIYRSLSARSFIFQYCWLIFIISEALAGSPFIGVPLTANSTFQMSKNKQPCRPRRIREPPSCTSWCRQWSRRSERGKSVFYHATAFQKISCGAQVVSVEFLANLIVFSGIISIFTWSTTMSSLASSSGVFPVSSAMTHWIAECIPGCLFWCWYVPGETYLLVTSTIEYHELVTSVNLICIPRCLIFTVPDLSKLSRRHVLKIIFYWNHDGTTEGSLWHLFPPDEHTFFIECEPEESDNTMDSIRTKLLSEESEDGCGLGDRCSVDLEQGQLTEGSVWIAIIDFCKPSFFALAVTGINW